MSARKKSTSTTESSSGSSSDSSSSSGSSSGSDSNSSSSDSESSSSQEPNRRSSSASNNAQQPEGKNLSANTILASNATSNSGKKPPARRISEAKSQTKIDTNEKLSTSAANKGKAIAAVAKSQQQRTAANRPTTTAFSSDEESVPTKSQTSQNQQSKKPTAPDVKKKPVAQIKSKTSTTNVSSVPTATSQVQPAHHQGSLTTPLQPQTGGKAPPAVVKQQQQQLHGLTKAIANKSNLNPKNNSKTIPLSGTGGAGGISKPTVVDGKKKSIFSPDNSTESEDEDPMKKIPKATAVTKAKPQQPPSAPVPSQAPVNSTAKAKGRAINNRNKPTIKSSAESSESSSQTETTTTSDTESESSMDSSPTTTKISATNKKPTNKTAHSSAIAKTDSKENGNSESDIENKPAQNVMRKLTRSSSTRKSKHLTAIFNPAKASETESESESKRSLSKSPVKRTPGTKGKSTKNTKTNSKNNIGAGGGSGSSPMKKTAAVREERRCPVDGCNSNGHLGGQQEKHFTQEACPFYHNMTLADTKAWALERVQRQDERKKALILYEPAKKSTTVEQKAYQLKVKDIRSKFKPNPPSPNRGHVHTVVTGSGGGGSAATTAGNIITGGSGGGNCASGAATAAVTVIHKDREPSLIGLVSDYDLQLFREAQALASEKIEEEVKDIPIGKGTKYILMGRHTMEVWYQSPYPDDAARLPKLYLCEFCLRYQKSEVGMKRHAAKCVWRHPPGDEIYRKGKLGVWQVDGKRHIQYCRYLCLLAKFFLDHKTLYCDVEPFLFYVMTLADSEGCHTVGYFSKEKNSFLNYNVSCILTLPPYQRKGFGRLLIDFSYLLTRVENKIGSPEKPLSDLGLISYRSYWKDVLLDYLCSRTGTTLSIKDVSQEMAINSYDIVSTLQALGMMKYWKGKHIILKKQDVLEEYAERVKSRGTVLKIDPSCLKWIPFVPPAPPGPS